MENCKDLLIVWRENAKSQETLKVKIVARNTKDSSLPFKEKPQMLFAIFVPCLMAGALYRTVSPNNPRIHACFAVSIRQADKVLHRNTDKKQYLICFQLSNNTVL